LRDFAVAKPLRNPFFKCPTCDALYQVISGESGPESVDLGGEVTRHIPLNGPRGSNELAVILLAS
jgi:hypothetical protein